MNDFMSAPNGCFNTRGLAVISEFVFLQGNYFIALKLLNNNNRLKSVKVCNNPS